MATPPGKLNIACVSQADSGHMNPIMLIADGLAERGHRVRVITLACAAEKCEKRAKAFGAEFVGLPCAKTERDIHSEADAKGTVPFFIMRDLMKPGLCDEFKRDRPHVIVADTTSLAASEAAEEFGIQLVINSPASLDFSQAVFRCPDLRGLVAFAGFAFAYTPIKMSSIPIMLNIAKLNVLAKAIVKQSTNALVLVNTFPGLEEVGPVPPCWKFTGPLAPLPQDVALDRTHPELHRFLAGARDVIYITLGSMVIPEKHIVVALFEAMKLAGCHVIWSLKEDCQVHLPSGSDPAFFVSSWLPQPALLCHPKVKAVVSHCGWGGCLECMQAGKPMLTLPFFGDQPDNAALVEKVGAALPLAPSPGFSTDNKGIGVYRPGAIKPRNVADRVQEILRDTSYFDTAQRLSRLSAAPGLGRQAVCEHVESAAVDGVAHLSGKKFIALAHQPPAVLPMLGAAATAAVLLPHAVVLLGAAATAAVMVYRKACGRQ